MEQLALRPGEVTAAHQASSYYLRTPSPVTSRVRLLELADRADSEISTALAANDALGLGADIEVGETSTDDYLGRAATMRAIRLDQLPEDKETLRRHQDWLGSLALSKTVRSPESTNPQQKSLAEALRRARRGDKEALKLVDMNVGTALGEGLEPVQYVFDVELEETQDGQIVQFGQTLSVVNENTLRFCEWTDEPVMYGRTVTESLSAFRLEDRNQEGLLDDHWVIDISLAPDLPRDVLEELRFFAPTMTGIIRGVTRREDGKLIMRSALVAGVVEEGAARHDLEAVRAIFVEDWGIKEAKDWSIDKFLKTQVAISKENLPNGPVDVVPSYDTKVERTTNREIYWGQPGKKGDYVSEIETSRRRDAARADLKQNIRNELLAKPDSFIPIEPINDLNKLVEVYGALKVIEDTSYDARIFGKEAKTHILQARSLIAAGDIVAARPFMIQAAKTARGYGCPGKREASESEADQQLDDLDPAKSTDKKEDSENNESKTVCCPDCKNNVPKKDVVQEDGTWRCPKCGYGADPCGDKSDLGADAEAEKEWIEGLVDDLIDKLMLKKQEPGTQA